LSQASNIKFEQRKNCRAVSQPWIPTREQSGLLTRIEATESAISRTSCLAKEKESNWLPAPAGNFSIWIRAYWPDNAILDGTWRPPVVRKIN